MRDRREGVAHQLIKFKMFPPDLLLDEQLEGQVVLLLVPDELQYKDKHIAQPMHQSIKLNR